jgi:hypothetical protein
LKRNAEILFKRATVENEKSAVLETNPVELKKLEVT